MISLSWGAASDVGRIRKNNQDAYLADGRVFVVADGMGGHVGGEIASRLAIDEFVKAFSDGADARDVVEVVQSANSAILDRAAHEPKLSGMGTTLCLLSVTESEGRHHLNLANVGDSRGYLLRDGELFQLTDDHTLVSEMLRAGEITRDEAGMHRARHILTRALGVDSDLEIDRWKIEPKAGDIYLLCSDGLTNELSDPEITQILAQDSSSEERARELVNAAVEAGGSDNVTCIVVQVEDASQPGGPAPGGESPKIVELPSQTKLRERLLNATHSVGAESDERNRYITAAQLKKEREDAVREQRQRENSSRFGGTAVVRVNPLISSSYVRTSDLSSIPVPLPKRATEKKFRLGTAIRMFLFLGLLVLILAGGIAAVGIYADHSYFVGIDGTRLAVYQGRPGGLLWYNPTVVDRTQVRTDQVASYHLSDLEKGVVEPSLPAALNYVNNLLNEANQMGSSTTTLPAQSPTTTTATVGSSG